MTNMNRAGAFLAAMTLGAGLGLVPAHAETTVVVGYQQIVGPFIAAIADGRLDAAAKEAGYKIDWRQFSSGGDISTALASGNVPVGVIGSTGIAAAATRGVEFELFWILDNIGKSEALVARNGSGIEKPEDLAGKNVAVPFVSTSHFHLLVGMDQVWKIDPRGVNILNMKPPQILAAWQRGDIDAAYVWPPVLTELMKEGTVIADSEQIGAASVPTFDGLVADKKFAAENPDFMAAFTKALAGAYADLTQDRALLSARINALAPYHARTRLADWRALAAAGEFELLACELMAHHYDPRYARARRRWEDGKGAVLRAETLDGAARGHLAEEILARMG